MNEVDLPSFLLTFNNRLVKSMIEYILASAGEAFIITGLRKEKAEY